MKAPEQIDDFEMMGPQHLRVVFNLLSEAVLSAELLSGARVETLPDVRQWLYELSDAAADRARRSVTR